MRVTRDLLSADFKMSERLILTVGSFDGVHVGHQQVISEVVHWARKSAPESGARSVKPGLLTFDPLPREVLYPHTFPGLLTATERRLELIEQLGVEIAFVLAFDKALADMSAECFVKSILVEKLAIEGIVVGHDCRFGAGAAGDYEEMAELGKRHGFGVRQVEPFMVDDSPVSSTLIRTKILAGDLDGAGRLLGRRYSLSGRVTSGSGIGRVLGFRTANIEPRGGLVPPDGIYAALVRFDATEVCAALNIGMSPTVKDVPERTVEAHILDFDGELYGSELEVVLVKKIRDERKFPDKEGLRRQIVEDIEQTRRILAGIKGAS
jgi:riboflavin kinase/FMN adenylyltransferase